MDALVSEVDTHHGHASAQAQSVDEAMNVMHSQMESFCQAMMVWPPADPTPRHHC